MTTFDPEQMSRLRARLEELRASDEMLWTERDFQLFCRWFKRHKEDMIDGKLRQLRFMARHEDAPVELRETKDEAIDTFLRYVVHREHVEGKTRAAVGNDHKAFRTLGDLVGIDRDKLPVVPTELGAGRSNLALNKINLFLGKSVEEVHDLIDQIIGLRDLDV
ncbi:hypothetical protein BRD56_03955 [Thermoplasmatales archaeon SW_10_69_26]|nr:MAG: hypothetical protein BRD56_03955 [Thermoplasmatales archaeon SW_10_69_26]